MLKETFYWINFLYRVFVGAHGLDAARDEHQESESMTIEGETQVKRTDVYSQMHHLEEQLVFPFIYPLCCLFFSHTLHPPTSSQHCSSSHLYLITAESAAVNRPHHTWCSFALNTAELIFALGMNWVRLKKKSSETRQSAAHPRRRRNITSDSLVVTYRFLIVRRFYLYALP